MVSRLLHEPTLRIKAAAERGGSYVYLQALRELFGLEPEMPDYELADEAARGRARHAHRRSPQTPRRPSVAPRRSGAPLA